MYSGTDQATTQTATAIPILPQDVMNFIGQMVPGVGNMPYPMGMGSYEDILDRLMQQHQPRGTPPVSTSILERLPEISISQIDVDQKVECAVCKDLFALNDKATKLPCDHRYHADCITPWLSQHNTCPVCRYELPVEDQEYEKDRKKRMASRNISEENLTSDSPPTNKTSDNESKQETCDSSINNTSNSLNPINFCELALIRKEDCALLKEETFIPLSCGHNFHTECLESFLRINSTIAPNSSVDSVSSFYCPVCRCDATVLNILDVD